MLFCLFLKQTHSSIHVLIFKTGLFFFLKIPMSNALHKDIVAGHQLWAAGFPSVCSSSPGSIGTASHVLTGQRCSCRLHVQSSTCLPPFPLSLAARSYGEDEDQGGCAGTGCVATVSLLSQLAYQSVSSLSLGAAAGDKSKGAAEADGKCSPLERLPIKINSG